MKKVFELTFYVTFGAGIAFGISSFQVISELFKEVNSFWAVVAICLSGLFCMLISSAISELASMYPSAPGIRTYLKVALPSRISLFLVYLYLMFMIMVAGIESYLFAKVVGQLFPTWHPLPVVLGLLAITVIINCFGLELPRGVQMFTTMSLILSVLVLAVVGTFHGTFHWSSKLISEPGQLASLPGAIGAAIYLFIGFEWVTMLGFNAKSYERKIPVSMPLAILTNIIAYSIFSIALSLCVKGSDITFSSIPQVPYFKALFGAQGAPVALALSILAIICCFNAGVMGGSRMIYILAREGSLPKAWAKMSLTTGAPIGGVIVLGGSAMIASIIILKFELQEVAAVVGAAIVCFVYAAFLWSIIRLRKTQPNARRTFRSPVPIWLLWGMIAIMPLLGIAALFELPGRTVEVLVTTLGLVVIAAVGVQLSIKYRDRRNQVAMRVQQGA